MVTHEIIIFTFVLLERGHQIVFRRDCTYGYFEQMDKPDQVSDLLKAGALTYYMHFGPEDWHILLFIWTCLDMQVPEQPLYCNPGKRLYSTRYLRRGTF